MIQAVCSLLIAVLAGMGVGGGGLLVIYLSHATSLPHQSAQGLNLAFFICAAIAALPMHLKRLRGNYKILLVLIVSGILSAVPFSLLANRVSPVLLRCCFAVFLIVTGCYTLFHKKQK